MKRHAGRQKQKNKLPILAALCFLTALALLLSNGAVTLAKYVLENQSAGTAVAAPFYFASDKLDGSNPYYTVSEPAEGADVEIAFTLCNFIDDLRWAKEDISYSCTVETASGSVIERDGAKASGTLSGKNSTANISLALQKSDFTDGPVTVTAKAAPYEKTISARFGFSQFSDGLQWSLEEQDGAAVLLVTGGDGTGVTVTWPDAVTPDPRGILRESSAGSGSFTAEPGVCYALVFLKTDPAAACRKDMFTVTKQTP